MRIKPFPRLASGGCRTSPRHPPAGILRIRASWNSALSLGDDFLPLKTRAGVQLRAGCEKEAVEAAGEASAKEDDESFTGLTVSPGLSVPCWSPHACAVKARGLPSCAGRKAARRMSATRRGRPG